MSDGASHTASDRWLPRVAPYLLTLAAVLLAWQIVVQPFIQRAPVEAAVRLAPGSPLVLRRAAESELAAGRIDNAAVLSREALVRSPFDAAALRVLGLAEARAGREDEADEILTLAGNWSLRDDPAHAWLVERRLRRGDYASSFAHADTLARRREDIQPQIFRLFTAAGVEDPQRVLPVVASLLASRPPWRSAYLASLNRTPQDIQLAASLAIMLEKGRSPMTNHELQGLYRTLLANRQLEALNMVRTRINRPPSGRAVTNGGFDEPSAPDPFQWRVAQKAGIVADVTSDDLTPSNMAFRVDYDGYATGVVVEQLLFLTPGTHGFSAKVRTETGHPADRLVWTISCAPGGEAIDSMPAARPEAVVGEWGSVLAQVDVPAGCLAQWLQLETRAADRRSQTVVWFDDVTISPVN